MGAKLGELAEATALANGKLDILVGDHRERGTRETVTFTSTVKVEEAKKIADVEVGKTREIASVNDVADRAKSRRALALKIIAGAVTILSSGLIGSQC